jgi:CRISPR/Cas system CSM-associated protein Csm4 (group 5 of RAMP superfamily)
MDNQMCQRNFAVKLSSLENKLMFISCVSIMHYKATCYVCSLLVGKIPRLSVQGRAKTITPLKIKSLFYKLKEIFIFIGVFFNKTQCL